MLYTDESQQTAWDRSHLSSTDMAREFCNLSTSRETPSHRYRLRIAGADRMHSLASHWTICRCHTRQSCLCSSCWIHDTRVGMWKIAKNSFINSVYWYLCHFTDNDKRKVPQEQNFPAFTRRNISRVSTGRAESHPCINGPLLLAISHICCALDSARPLRLRSHSINIQFPQRSTNVLRPNAHKCECPFTPVTVVRAGVADKPSSQYRVAHEKRPELCVTITMHILYEKKFPFAHL